MQRQFRQVLASLCTPHPLKVGSRMHLENSWEKQFEPVAQTPLASPPLTFHPQPHQSFRKQKETTMSRKQITTSQRTERGVSLKFYTENGRGIKEARGSLEQSRSAFRGVCIQPQSAAVREPAPGAGPRYLRLHPHPSRTSFGNPHNAPAGTLLSHACLGSCQTL